MAGTGAMDREQLTQKLREAGERYAAALERFLYPHGNKLDPDERRLLADQLRAFEAEYLALQNVLQSGQPHGFGRTERHDK